MQNTCILCDNPANWIRHTQFAGDHPFCDFHAKQEKDFPNNDSYTSWSIGVMETLEVK